MTRFFISLSEAAKFVDKSFNLMDKGEIFIPKMPSVFIKDLIKAIYPSCRLKTIGIRPGEKIHEEMITTSDGLRTIEFKDYFVIVPSSPKWKLDDFKTAFKSKNRSLCASPAPACGLYLKNISY